MVKLAHNTIGNCLVVKSMTGEIEWCYIEYLHELHTTLSLKFTNKISNVHINRKQKKMKVKIAVQLLSASIANALQYLKNNNYKQYLLGVMELY